MTLQYRIKYTNYDRWSEWKDWHGEDPIRFNHSVESMSVFAHEVREKPSFIPGFFTDGNKSVEWVEDESWFCDYNSNWTPCRVVGE